MPSVGAAGILGVALEAVSGTYLAPTTFIPFDSESMKWTQENVERRPIRNSPALLGMIKGPGHVEGDITFDCTPDLLIYFLYAARMSVVKTGAGPYNYVCTPTAVAVPTKTMSVTIKRGSEVSGYAGCVVSKLNLKIEDGAFKATVSLLGVSEATQTNPTPTWPTSTVFGAGFYTWEIPTGTPVTDTDKWEFEVDDSAEAQNRITNSIAAQFIAFKENKCSSKVERDFETRAEFDQFKNVTSKSLTMTASTGANNSVAVLTPVSFINSYEYNLGGQGDLLRASVEYAHAVNAAGNNYTITLNTITNIT